MSSIEWSDAQTRFLIDERKQRNAEFHLTPNKKKLLIWDDIAEKINEHENTNFFTGVDCRKKFENLKKAYKTAVKYRKGGKKRSLIGEGIYEEFSSEFWLKPDLPFERVHNESVRILSESTFSSSSPVPSRSQTSSYKTIVNTPVPSRPVTPSIETSAISRPVTPTLPSFSQSANVINVTINYAGTDSKRIDSDEQN